MVLIVFQPVGKVLEACGPMQRDHEVSGMARRSFVGRTNHVSSILEAFGGSRGVRNGYTAVSLTYDDNNNPRWGPADSCS